MAFLDRCIFTATSSGTGDFVVSAAVTGYQTPASAGVTDGATYSYAAQSADLSQWEVGQGVYTVSTTTLARTTVLFNSSGTTAHISFSAAPQVMVTLLDEDVRTILTSDGTFFVATTGSDTTGNGTVGNPWATGQHAVDFITNNIDGGGHYVIIKFADGTYAGIDFIGFPPNCPGLVLYGHSLDSTKVIIQDLGNGACLSISAPGFPSIFLASLTIDSNIAGTSGIVMNFPCNVLTGNQNFDLLEQLSFINSSGGVAGYCVKDIGNPSTFQSISQINVSGNRSGFLQLGSPGCFAFIFFPLIITGTPHWSNYFVESFGGYLEVDDVITGSATGAGVNMSEMSVLHFGTANAIPGDSFGQAFTGELNALDVSGEFMRGSVSDPGYNYSVQVNGFSISLGNSDWHVIIDPAGTLATGTISMCPKPFDGQIVNIRSTQIITALTISPNSGQSVAGNPTTIALGGIIEGIYRASNTTWYF